MGSTFCIELASASGRGYRLSKTAFSSAGRRNSAELIYATGRCRRLVVQCCRDQPVLSHFHAKYDRFGPDSYSGLQPYNVSSIISFKKSDVMNSSLLLSLNKAKSCPPSSKSSLTSLHKKLRLSRWHYTGYAVWNVFKLASLTRPDVQRE